MESAAVRRSADGVSSISRSLVQLAVVNLEGARGVFQPVVEQLTSRSGLLLIVCGNEGDIDEEIWVRQLGAWLYLPGVVDDGNFTLLCGEARHIAERLWKSTTPEHVSASGGNNHNSYS